MAGGRGTGLVGTGSSLPPFMAIDCVSWKTSVFVELAREKGGAAPAAWVRNKG